MNPLNERKKRLEKELENLSGNMRELTDEETLQIVKSFDDILTRGNFEEIRMIIESLIYRIDIDGEDITIHWKFL